MAITIEKGPTGRIKGLRMLLAGMTREDVLATISAFSAKEAAKHGFTESTDFDLIHDGRRLPPKAIFGLAAARRIGRPLTPAEFSGDDTAPSFAILRDLGFAIERKAVSSLTPSGSRTLILLQGYDRQEIARVFEPGAKFTPGAGRWGIQGIVESPPDSGNFVFMVTLGKPVEGNPYQDALTLDGRLIWESQTQQDFESPAIKKLLAHDATVNNIHLFLRARKSDKYAYLGLLSYFSHDPSKQNPVHFIWTVQNWDLGQEQLDQLQIPVRPPLDPAFSLSSPPAATALLERVDPPATAARTGVGRRGGRKVNEHEVDWAARDLRDRQLGLQGEKLVLQHEISALQAAGRSDLADQVQHVAITDCTAGYDIASFHADGRPKRIEVKTTQGSASTPFYISLNEVLASRDGTASFSIYRVFDFTAGGSRVRFFELEGNVEETCGLEPVNFRATPRAGQIDN